MCRGVLHAELDVAVSFCLLYGTRAGEDTSVDVEDGGGDIVRLLYGLDGELRGCSCCRGGVLS